VAHSEGCAATLVESLPQRMQIVIDREGYGCHIEWIQSNSAFKGYINVQNSWTKMFTLYYSKYLKIRHKKKVHSTGIKPTPYGSEPSVLPTELVVFYMK
jgi:hypothetical protein